MLIYVIFVKCQESLEEEKRKSKMLETVLIDQLCRCRVIFSYAVWISLTWDLWVNLPFASENDFNICLHMYFIIIKKCYMVVSIEWNQINWLLLESWRCNVFLNISVGTRIMLLCIVHSTKLGIIMMHWCMHCAGIACTWLFVKMWCLLWHHLLPVFLASAAHRMEIMYS